MTGSDRKPVGRIEEGRVGDYVDLSGLDSDQVDHFLFLARANDVPYRSGPSGVEFAIGHRDVIDEMLAAADAFVADDSEREHADELATLGKRALGFFFDATAVSVVGAFATLAALLVAEVGMTPPVGEDRAWQESAVVWTVPIVVSFLLICVATFRKGRTIGKSGASTMVVDARTLGEITFRQSFVRWIVPIGPGVVAAIGRSFVSTPLLLWSAATVAMVLIYAAAWFDGFSRGIHDRLAGTIVVLDRQPRRGSDQLRIEEQLRPGLY